MKKIIGFAGLFITLAFTACNNDAKQAGNTDQSTADSLLEQVMDGHDVGMAKTPKLTSMQKEAHRILDSIKTLPAKAQQAAAPLKTRLDSLVKQLEYADFAMNKWMNEFNYDSAKNNVQERIKYLTDEKLKVGKVKEAILGSLAKADSVLKSKF